VYDNFPTHIATDGIQSVYLLRPGLYNRGMRRIRIKHTTAYYYKKAVSLLPHTMHLRPREGHDLRLESSRLDINIAFQIHWQRDVYGNSIAIVNFPEPATELIINSEVVVEHYEEQPVEFILTDSAQHYPFYYDAMEQIDLTPYQLAIYPQHHSILQEWVATICHNNGDLDTIDLLTRINNKIVTELEYRVREEPGVQSPAETLSRGTGSCRDFATLFIEICRSCGLASRFISGYLLNEAAIPGSASTHAWSEIYLPGAGWRGFDSTSGVAVGGDHIAVAVHRHPEAIPPIAGSFTCTSNAKPRMVVEVQVNRLNV
jgi:transglutaminase-like putative cysteine protease